MTNILYAVIANDPNIWAITDWDRHGSPLGIPLGAFTRAQQRNLALIAGGRLVTFFHAMVNACEAVERIEAAQARLDRVTYRSGYPSAEQDPDRSTDPAVLERLRETGR